MIEVKVKNGIIKPGDSVLAMPGSVYSGLIGTVTDIKLLGSNDRETDNETDDIYIDFSGLDYSKKQQMEIEKAFSKMYGETKPFDELSLDMVIMPPDALIKIEDDKLYRFIRVRFHHEDSGHCTTTFQTVGKEKRRYFNRSDCGGWYTVNPSGGYWENDSMVKKEIVFQIVSKKGKVLFTESNGFFEQPFSPRNFFLKDTAKAFAKEHGLVGHEQWKSFITNSPGYEEFIKNNYRDNWLYSEVETIQEQTITQFDYLDFKYKIIETVEKHIKSGLVYRAYKIISQDNDCAGYICGYRFLNGN